MPRWVGAAKSGCPGEGGEMVKDPSREVILGRLDGTVKQSAHDLVICCMRDDESDRTR
jgi:hypothetical protein